MIDKNIYINNKPFPHPIDFAMVKKPNIVSTVTTMAGNTISDSNGWKYDDITLKWEWIQEDELSKLLNMTKEGTVFNFKFQELGTDRYMTVQAYRTSCTYKKRRSVDYRGGIVWTDINIALSFPECHK